MKSGVSQHHTTWSHFLVAEMKKFEIGSWNNLTYEPIFAILLAA